jgi:hypothetical protein
MSIQYFPPLGSTPGGGQYVQYGGGTVDSFGRLRVSQPYTLFDGQARYANDSAFDTLTATGGTTTYNTNQSSTSLNVTTTSGSRVVRQTYRSMSYQPGKSFLLLATFAMGTGKTNLTQRVGLCDDNNGVFFSQDGTTLNMNIRSNTTGSPLLTTVAQSAWNGDKLNGTGASGITLDVTKTQIFFMDLEWLGVGIVRTGFVLNGTYVICHTFYNANVQTVVYMTTATLPVRYEIVNTGTTESISSLTQICASVMSEGGYEQASQIYWARMTGTTGAPANVPVTNIFVPLVTIRLNASKLGAVVLPAQYSVLPITSSNYEVCMIRNATLTGASYVTGTFPDVDYDITATAMTYTASNIFQLNYITSTPQGTSNVVTPQAYNWDLQLGVSLAGVSDTITLAVRTIGASGAANSAYGSLGFYDLSL